MFLKEVELSLKEIARKKIREIIAPNLNKKLSDLASQKQHLDENIASLEKQLKKAQPAEMPKISEEGTLSAVIKLLTGEKARENNALALERRAALYKESAIKKEIEGVKLALRSLEKEIAHLESEKIKKLEAEGFKYCARLLQFYSSNIKEMEAGVEIAFTEANAAMLQAMGDLEDQQKSKDVVIGFILEKHDNSYAMSLRRLLVYNPEQELIKAEEASEHVVEKAKVSKSAAILKIKSLFAAQGNLLRTQEMMLDQISGELNVNNQSLKDKLKDQIQKDMEKQVYKLMISYEEHFLGGIRAKIKNEESAKSALAREEARSQLELMTLRGKISEHDQEIEKLTKQFKKYKAKVYHPKWHYMLTLAAGQIDKSQESFFEWMLSVRSDKLPEGDISGLERSGHLNICKYVKDALANHKLPGLMVQQISLVPKLEEVPVPIDLAPPTYASPELVVDQEDLEEVLPEGSIFGDIRIVESHCAPRLGLQTSPSQPAVVGR